LNVANVTNYLQPTDTNILEKLCLVIDSRIDDAFKSVNEKTIDDIDTYIRVVDNDLVEKEENNDILLNN